MQLTVIGATGPIGRELVEHALEAGHDVTALTRDARRVTTRHDRLSVVEGQADAPEDCARAVAGSDAVVVVLGAGRRGGIRERGTRAVVEAMRARGVRRLVVQSTLGVGSSRANLDLLWKYVFFGVLLRAAYADHVRQERVVEESGLDWTIVRPSAFADTSPGPVRQGFGPSEQGLRLKIGRSDLADVLLAQAETDSDIGRAVSVSA